MQFTHALIDQPTAESDASPERCPIHPTWCRVPHDTDPAGAEHYGQAATIGTDADTFLSVRLEDIAVDDPPNAWVDGAVSGELNSRGLARLIISLEQAIPALWRQQATLAEAEMRAEARQ